MPGVAVDGVNEDVGSEGNVTLSKHNSAQNIRSPKSTLSPQSPRSVNDDDADVTLNEALDTSIEHLYDNVCEMQSSDQSPSRRSFSSDDDNESRIDWELRHLVGGEMREVEIMEEEVANEEEKEEGDCSEFEIREDGFGGQKSGSKTQSKKSSDECTKPSLEKISPFVKDKKGKILRKKTPLVRKRRNLPLVGSDSGLDNPDLGPFLLEKARDMISSGDNLNKALDFALQASKSFEICADGNEKCSLELIMSLHVTAAVYCSLGRYNEAIPVLKRSIELPSIEDGENYALAKFAGNMQLGDTFAMLGQLGNSIECYTDGLNIQREVLGEKDIRVGETCRYLAEVHVQAMQFDEAEKVCEIALNIHRESGSPGSLEEAADRRLMGLIYETKGDHEKALEHLVLASMAMVANGQEKEVVSVDCSIGDTYLSLSRYDEAIFAYETALANFKSSKGENHPAVASVFVRLADLYNKTGNLRESKSYCENALRIYGKPVPGISQEDIASGFTDVSAIYESMNELDQAIKLLQKALKIYNNAPGQQNTIAGIEAQLGCMFYVLGNYTESYNSFKSAVTKMRASGEKKSAFFGLGLNQMGLCCVQRYAINEATDLFEEAKSIMEKEHGQYHPDTLGVYSNLAGTYDAMGRLDDAIQLLEYVVGMREEKLGTANPDVDDEKRRLAELLKEAGKVRSRKATSLGNLFGGNS